MQTYHASSNPLYSGPQTQHSYAQPQNGRPGNSSLGSGRGLPEQSTPYNHQGRAPPRPGMFPASAPASTFKHLQPGETLPGGILSPGMAMRHPTAGPGMGMSPRPMQQRQHPSTSMSIGAGINDAGYPTITATPAVHNAAHVQGPQQIYRPVPGMGPQVRSASRGQINANEQQGIVTGMNHLSVTGHQPSPSQPHQPYVQTQGPHLRPPPSSHAYQQPSRSHSVGGASISSTASASTTRTTGSSTGSSLNLHQHYVGGPAFASHDQRPSQMSSQYSSEQTSYERPQRPRHVCRSSSGTASSQRSQNGTFENGSGGGPNNPLLDLLGSEREYVERLMTIVRRVAGAWSRTNFPPPLLDRMFRAVEGIFKISKALVQKLDDLGANTSTPKALGDLLMQWVEDLIGPYTKYASIYLTGYNDFPSAVNNQKLLGILTAISQALPPVAPMKHWTLDALFQLPYIRLRYYRRLYDKLLGSASEGRSDHQMLKVATEKLNNVVMMVEERLDMDVNEVEAHGEGTVLNRLRVLRAASVGAQQNFHPGTHNVPTSTQCLEQSRSASAPVDRGVSKLEEERRSVAKWEQQKKNEGTSGSRKVDPQAGLVATTSQNRQPSPSPTGNTHGGGGKPGMSLSASKYPASPVIEIDPSSPASRTTITPIERSEKTPLTDLEIRLDTAKAVDLFTMQPKVCRLQIAPSTLTFARQLRRATDTVIHFNPTSTKQQIVHRRAHIFILSDLFLMCERMSVTEKAEKAKEVLANHPSRVGDGGPLPEMWLLYPPLAGRHLSVLSGSVETELIVTVMKRETFLLSFDDRESREDTLKALQDCVGFASSVPRSDTPRSASISPRLDGSMVNDNKYKNRQYTQPQPEHGFGHATCEHMVPPSRNASLPISASHLHESFQDNSMTAYRDPPIHHTQPSHSTYSAHHGAPFPRTVSAPVSQTRCRPDEVARPINQTFTALPPHLQPPRTQSAEVAHVNSRNGSIAVGGPHILSSDSSHRILNVLDEPDSPVEDSQQRRAGPTVVAACMKCKVFLKHGHQQWMPLGPAKLQLYVQQGTNIKQLVVEADTRDKTMLISTIVLTDGVERVAKTGVAVEISDHGARTGLIYLLQTGDSAEAEGLFSRLISGSDRARSLSGRKG